MTPAIADVPVDRAHARFQEIALYEQRLQVLEARIADLKAETKMLREQHDHVLGHLRTAARDEGDLPLLPFDFPEVGS